MRKRNVRGTSGSDVGAYAGAARRRIHLVTVLFRPPSGHRPDRRQTRHDRILQIGLRLAIIQADATCSYPLHRHPPGATAKHAGCPSAWPSPPNPSRHDRMGGIHCGVSRHMSVETYLALPHYVDNLLQPSLPRSMH